MKVEDLNEIKAKSSTKDKVRNKHFCYTYTKEKVKNMSLTKRSVNIIGEGKLEKQQRTQKLLELYGEVDNSRIDKVAQDQKIYFTTVYNQSTSKIFLSLQFI